jgi:putative membrane protein
MASKTNLSRADQRAISRAIAMAEARTSGEIIAVMARASDDYIFIPLLWAALAALLVPLGLLFATDWPAQHVYIAQLATFAVLAAIGLWWPVRVRLVPNSIKRARVHRSALQQFLAQDIHTTKSRTGILIYVSLAERIAEVVADEGIYAKVPAERWDEIIEALVARLKSGKARAGFVTAIGGSGDLLAEHFPPGSSNENELPDHLIML